MFALKNILVATDFSDCSEAALSYGRELARQFGARLHVLHVVETVLADSLGVYGYASVMPELQVELEESDRRRLEQLISDDDRTSLRATTTLCSFDTPAHAIDDYARTENIDLIVIGTHGRRGLSHLVLGSVAEKVVRTAPCPVLTVRRPEPQAVAPNAGVASASAPR